MRSERGIAWARVFAACAVLLCACSSRPEPTLQRVVPGAIEAGQTVTVRIEGSGLLAHVQSDPWASGVPNVDGTFRIRIDDRELPLDAVTAFAPTELTARLPADLALGSHEVTVITPEGKRASLTDALVVEQTLVTQMTLETKGDGSGAQIGAQQVPVGATLALAAVLRSAGSGRFLGLAPSRWTLQPLTGTNPLGTLSVDGAQTSANFVPAASGTAVLIATALDGTMSARSGVLTVRSGALRLAFSSAPQQLGAGLCSAPLTLAAQDSTGTSFAFPDAAPIELSSGAVSFFADASCTQAISRVVPAAGALSATAYVRGIVAGTQTLSASSASLGSATQGLTLVGGPATALVWSPVASPVLAQTPLDVEVSAEDAYGNLASGFSGNATLSVTPGSTVSCSVGCAGSTSATFNAGRWSGTIELSGPAATGQRLALNASGVAGSSNVFTLVPSRSPPTAVLAHAPAVPVVGASVTFDASGSSDLQTPVSGLLYSFDSQGSAGAPPWSPWSVLPTATFSFSSAGAHPVRVAVLDGDGDIGYAVETVTVASSASAVCTVTLWRAATDDGASACAGPFGPDGQLSLAEAARISDANPGTVITFAPGLSVTGPTSIQLNGPANVVGAPGASVSGVTLTLAGGGTLSELALSDSGGTPLVVPKGASVTLDRVTVTDYASITANGTLSVWRSRFSGCTSACFAQNDAAASLVVRFSEMADASLGISSVRCASGGLDVLSSNFVRLGTGIQIGTSCASTLIQHGTFVGNQVAINYQGGSGHVLRNVIASDNTTAVTCSGSPSGLGEYFEFWNNFSDGCFATLPSIIRADPLYVFAAQDDYRLELGSPAVNAAKATGADVNDTAPGLYFGAGPDLGGDETW